jgi:hypothetical protein
VVLSKEDRRQKLEFRRQKGEDRGWEFEVEASIFCLLTPAFFQF